MSWRPAGTLLVPLTLALALVVAVTTALPAAAWSSRPRTQSTLGEPDFTAHIIFTIQSDRIDESSDLAVSTVHPGLAYTTNDSGDGPFIYVLNHHGKLVGTTTLAGVDPVDIEALSAGHDGSLVVGDVGDSNGMRDSIQLYKIPQPKRGDHTVTPDKVSLTYADGGRNAESLVYDSATGTALVVSKEQSAHIYRTQPHVFRSATARSPRSRTPPSSRRMPPCCPVARPSSCAPTRTPSSTPTRASRS